MLNIYKKFFPDIKKGLTVFLYHDINDQPSQFGRDYNLTVSKKLFRKQINWITNNYSVISPRDLISGKQLPENAALITFDDGFEGAFENGISYLESLKIPCIVFLNMSSIEKEIPLISSVATYLQRKAGRFGNLFERLGLKTPFHLNLTPEIYSKIQSEIPDLDLDEIVQYQGKLANLVTLKKWENSNYVFLGNHLYEHWNSASLDSGEFEFQFKENRKKLSNFKNSIDLFSFPNGQPDLCFSNLHVQALNHFGCKRIFFSLGGTNSADVGFLFNRTDLTTYEHNEFKMYYRIAMTRLIHKLPRKAAVVIRRFL